MSSSHLLSFSENDDGKFHGNPYSTPPTKSFSSSSDSEPKTPSRSSGMKKSRDMSKPDTGVRSKQSREGAEARLPANKKKKNSGKMGASVSKPQIDIEELLAQTYPKEPPVLGDETRRPEKPSEPGKHLGKKWSAEDEMKLANVLLASSAGGQVNMTSFYERAKETLQSESHSQLYEKMRIMRTRFWTIESQLRNAKMTEDIFPYRSRQEADLYKVWKRIWSRHEITEAAQDIEMEHNRELRSRSHAKQVHNRDANEGRHDSRIEAAQDKEMEQNGESDSHDMRAHNGEVNEEPPEEEEHRQAEEGKAASRTAWNHDEEFNLMQKETKDLVRKVKNNVQAMLDGAQAKMEGLTDNLFKRASAASQGQSLRNEIRIGTCVCSSLSRRMEELQGVRSVRDFSGLDEAEARTLKQKWCNHQIEELRIFSERLGLLKEECKLCIKDLETRNVNHKS